MVTVIGNKHDELVALCKRYGVERLELFGSAASEQTFDPSRSDVDCIVEFRAEQELGPWMRHYFNFRDALAELFGYPVDLVMSSAMKNPYFIREANRSRKLLYGT